MIDVWLKKKTTKKPKLLAYGHICGFNIYLRIGMAQNLKF